MHTYIYAYAHIHTHVHAYIHKYRHAYLQNILAYKFFNDDDNDFINNKNINSRGLIIIIMIITTME